uniref:Metallo-beta-lactamase domain-containing protein n=1 Tax=Plectus sambesii TaxID=2011161 RepID=A0A914ULW6_9BILA
MPETARKVQPAPDDPACIRPLEEAGLFRNPWAGVPIHPDLRNSPLKRGGKHIPYTVEELKWLQPVLEPIFFHEGDKDGVLRATWLGHASALLYMEGLTILFDPVLVEKVEQPTSPDHPIYRMRRPPCFVEEIPKLDAVVISHNHPSHLDVDTCANIVAHFGPTVPFFVPVGVGDVLRAESGVTNITEMSWWEETWVKKDHPASIVCLPAQHWSMRSVDDVNKSLWASWAVIGDRYKAIHIGDSGYNSVFKTIGNRYGPFDLALIPIGGYVPRDTLRFWKLNPADAVQVHKDLQAVQSIGINWATWFNGLGASEHYMEPQATLREEGEKAGLTDQYRRVMDFITMWLGQTWSSEKHGLDGLLMSNPTD